MNLGFSTMRLFILMRGVLMTACMLWLSSCATPDKVGSSFRDCKHCPQMVIVPAGAATVGGNVQEQQREGVAANYAQRELPQRRVTIAREFAVGRYEVTRGEYARFVAATQYSMPLGCYVLDMIANTWGLDALRSWRDPGFAQTERHPVVCVSWQDAQAYVRWLAKLTGEPYRLLSDGEWEYAARGGTTTTRFWGDSRVDLCAHANAADLDLATALHIAEPAADLFFQCRDGFSHTAPVGSFPANPFGLYDIEGNVWEWTADCDHVTLDALPLDGSVSLDGDCAGHIDRGGAWVNSPKFLRIAARHKDVTTIRNTVLGFRVARDLP